MSEFRDPRIWNIGEPRLKGGMLWKIDPPRQTSSYDSKEAIIKSCEV